MLVCSLWVLWSAPAKEGSGNEFMQNGHCREYTIMHMLNVFWFAFFFWSQQANAELGAVWSVGQRIWQRDFPGIYTTISAHQWSETIQPIMEALRGTNWAPVGSMAFYVALNYFCVPKKPNRQVAKWQLMKNQKWSGRLLLSFCRFYLKDFRYQGYIKSLLKSLYKQIEVFLLIRIVWSFILEFYTPYFFFCNSKIYC